MSEKFENREINEQDSEQVAGGKHEYGSREFIFRCEKCKDIKIIWSYALPVPVPTCCGESMFLMDIRS